MFEHVTPFFRPADSRELLSAKLQHIRPPQAQNIIDAERRQRVCEEPEAIGENAIVFSHPPTFFVATNALYGAWRVVSKGSAVQVDSLHPLLNEPNYSRTTLYDPFEYPDISTIYLQHEEINSSQLRSPHIARQIAAKALEQLMRQGGLDAKQQQTIHTLLLNRSQS